MWLGLVLEVDDLVCGDRFLFLLAKDIVSRGIFALMGMWIDCAMFRLVCVVG